MEKNNKKLHVSPSYKWKYNTSINDNFFDVVKSYTKNLLENLFDIKIVKKKNYGIITDRNKFLISNNLKKKKVLPLVNILNNFLKKLNIKSSKKILSKLINEHDEIYFNRNPIYNNSGGIGYNNSLFLFIFLKNIKVNLVIESGIWQGYTSYLIDQGCKGVRNIKFDINLSKIIYKSKKAEYNEFDIDTYNFSKIYKQLKKSLAFFDDHVSQLKRFQLSDRLDIPYMVFDDDIRYEAIHSDGWPAIPTISMMRDRNFLRKGTWNNFGKIAKFNFNDKIDKKKLKKYLFVTAPNISEITGYYIQCPMTFVVKK